MCVYMFTHIHTYFVYTYIVLYMYICIYNVISAFNSLSQKFSIASFKFFSLDPRLLRIETCKLFNSVCQDCGDRSADQLTSCLTPSPSSHSPPYNSQDSPTTTLLLIPFQSGISSHCNPMLFFSTKIK